MLAEYGRVRQNVVGSVCKVLWSGPVIGSLDIFRGDLAL